MMRKLVFVTVNTSRTFCRPISTSSSSRFISDFLREEDFEKRRCLIQQKYLNQGEGNGSTRSSFDALHHSLVHSPEGIRYSMKLREDVLRVSRQLKKTSALDGKPSTSSSSSSSTLSPSKSSWQALDDFLFRFLSSVFCRQALSLKRITFETSSGNILERVARGEAVHSVRSLSELKRRLHNGRRCFGLFHHALPDEPLAFVHIALTERLSKSIKDIDQAAELNEPTCAMFYSVNSPHSSLSGLDLAEAVIKRAAAELQMQHPTLKIFSTLSPIPGFLKWFEECVKSESLKLPAVHLSSLQRAYLISKENEAGNDISDVTSSSQSTQHLLSWLLELLIHPVPLWTLNEQLMEVIREPLVYLTAEYLVRAKIKNLPRDPVARFHLRNGAVLYNVNWFGNPSRSGFMASAGLMTNYLYTLNEVNVSEISNDYRQIVDLKGNDLSVDLSTVEKRKEYFKSSGGDIIMSRRVRDIISPPLS